MATLLSSESTSESEINRLLSSIENTVLWNAMQLVHHANNVRHNPDATKVGGHQASSASISTIMTSLYFDFLEKGDKVSIKPHGSPIYHAIQYLLGNLDISYMTELRAFHGLQAYPSRTKDPDNVDFSTGSVGLGPVAPNFSSIVRSYVDSHEFGQSDLIQKNARYISIVGDAELDEGSIWESIAEPEMSQASNIIWIVDLNRQSLDRVIPGIRVRAWREMFDANGWTVIDAKYGKILENAFAQPNGELLRIAIDEMTNQAYQRLLRVDTNVMREWLPSYSRYPDDMKRLLSRWDDTELYELFHNLGGHDFTMLRESFRHADSISGPAVVFAYTLKGFKLPSVGDPQNHSVTLSEKQMEELRITLGIANGANWPKLDRGTPEGELTLQVSERLTDHSVGSPAPSADIPWDLGRGYSGTMSTQQIFGLVLTDMSRSLGDISNRIVTVSPDVASSTNLGGWINRVGVWRTEEDEELPDEGIVRALNWNESKDGQHIELGISENNLFMMLGQLGTSFEMNGEMLFPIGTVYDPFIRRGLDAFVYSVYGGGKFIVVGTPSGLSLAPEGGAHQSMMTPSIGAEMPTLDAYEPCFGQELEWIMLSALHQIRKRGRCTYLRLTSKPVDQGIMTIPDDPDELEKLRLQVLNGAYCLVDMSSQPGFNPESNVVNVFVSGAMVPEAYKASQSLTKEGIFTNVINVTGPGPLYRKYNDYTRETIRTGKDLSKGVSHLMPGAIPGAPVVTIADAHPHSLAWIGSALGSKTIPLGVDEWGQSGNREDLYREYGTDSESIINACFAALDI
ncbi:MAG: pyruvate dehydrogenase [Dehalococcoidia bacterium]